MNSGYKVGIQRLNQNVVQKSKLKKKIILNFIQFCEKPYLPLKGHNEKIHCSIKGFFFRCC